MNKIHSTFISKQSSADDIREYFNRVYNQMKADPEGRYPANFEDSWQLFFDSWENGTAYLKANCIEDKDFLVLYDPETSEEADYLISILTLGMFVKQLRPDLISLFNDAYLLENEKSLKQLCDLTRRHKKLIEKFHILKGKSRKQHEHDIATIAKLEETIKELEDTISKRDDTIDMLLTRFEDGEAGTASHHKHIIGISKLKSFFHTFRN